MSNLSVANYVEGEQSENATQVLLLSDEPKNSEYMQEVVAMAGELIRAAKADRLVTLVAAHDDSAKKSVILCAMFPSEDGLTASYAPLAQLFDSNWCPWPNLKPPKAAMMAQKSSE